MRTPNPERRPVGVDPTELERLEEAPNLELHLTKDEALFVLAAVTDAQAADPSSLEREVYHTVRRRLLLLLGVPVA